MRIASWNVNGLRAIAKKGFFEWVDDYDPDVVLLQETKCYANDLPDELREIPGFFTRFVSAKRKGYSGAAVFTRFEPDEWIDGLGDARFDKEGRVVSARFGDLIVTSAYFPNSQDGGTRLDYKLAFGRRMREFLDGHVADGRNVVLGGDYNIAHRPIDLARPDENKDSAGFLPEERAWLDELLANGWVDTWRRQHPDEKGVYTWWSFRTLGRQRNVGWRIDYLCVNEGFWPEVGETGIQDKVEGSDHCPVTIEVKNPK